MITKAKSTYEELGKRIQILEKNKIKHKKVLHELNQANSILNTSPLVAFIRKNEKGRPVKYVYENVVFIGWYIKSCRFRSTYFPNGL